MSRDNIIEPLNFDELKKKFETTEELLVFLKSLEETDLIKLKKGIISSYVIKNWDAFHKESLYIKEIGEFLEYKTFITLSEKIKSEYTKAIKKSSVMKKIIRESLKSVDELSNSIDSFLEISLKNRVLAKKTHDFPSLNYNSIRNKDSVIIKINPLSIEQEKF